MADEPKSTSSSSPKSDKSGKSASETGNTLAPTQGSYEAPGPAADTPGTPEHLGSDRPYEGAVPEAEQQ